MGSTGSGERLGRSSRNGSRATACASTCWQWKLRCGRTHGYFGEDEEFWGVTALLHDLDFERFPDMDDQVNGHPADGAPHVPRVGLSRGDDRGGGRAMRRSSAIPRRTRLASALYASDELTGLIMAVAYVRPSKDLRDVEVSSVKKKWKDKLFAAAVNRADIEEGAAELGLDLWEHVRIVLEGMKLVAGDLGLDGRLAAPARISRRDLSFSGPLAWSHRSWSSCWRSCSCALAAGSLQRRSQRLAANAHILAPPGAAAAST